jgi:hypothetical protein
LATGPQRRLWKNKNRSTTCALGGEPISVSATIALEQSVAFQLAQIVAKFVQTVGLGRELKRGEDGVVDLLGGPAAHDLMDEMDQSAPAGTGH